MNERGAWMCIMDSLMSAGEILKQLGPFKIHKLIIYDFGLVHTKERLTRGCSCMANCEMQMRLQRLKGLAGDVEICSCTTLDNCFSLYIFDAFLNFTYIQYDLFKMKMPLNFFSIFKLILIEDSLKMDTKELMNAKKFLK